MRVLHIGATCGFGGAESVTLALIREQRKDGIHADAFFTIDKGGARTFEGVCDVWFAHRYSLTDIILGGDYDILHIVASSAASVAPAVRRALFQGGIVVTHHGAWCGCPFTENVVSVSRFGAEEIREFCGSRVRVIYNGIDLRLFFPPDERKDAKPVAAWVGRSEFPEKDSAALLVVCSLGILERFQVTVADPSPDSTGIDESWLPSGSRLVKRLVWEEMPDFYRAVAESGGFVLSTSRVERCPMNLIEAQACGCPVIAPSVGGIPEVVIDRQTGVLFDRTKGPSAVREAVEWLYSGDNWDNASTAAAEYAAAHFSSRRMHEEYLEVYEAALAGKRRSFLITAARKIMAPVFAVALRKRHLVRK